MVFRFQIALVCLIAYLGATFGKPVAHDTGVPHVHAVTDAGDAGHGTAGHVHVTGAADAGHGTVGHVHTSAGDAGHGTPGHVHSDVGKV